MIQRSQHRKIKLTIFLEELLFSQSFLTNLKEIFNILYQYEIDIYYTFVIMYFRAKKKKKK